jgi:hypothetical protein
MRNPDNCSGIRDGHAWTEDDEELFTDLSPTYQIDALIWARYNLEPTKTYSNRHTSYGLKHLLEQETGVYMTNNQFKDMMLTIGYIPKDKRVLNWCFNIRDNYSKILDRINRENSSTGPYKVKDLIREALNRYWKGEAPDECGRDST